MPGAPCEWNGSNQFLYMRPHAAALLEWLLQTQLDGHWQLRFSTPMSCCNALPTATCSGWRTSGAHHYAQSPAAYMQCGSAVRDWCSLQVTRSLWLPFVRAGIAPDCFALSIVVVVELSLRVRDGPRHGLSQNGGAGPSPHPMPIGVAARARTTYIVCCA